jgi:hypothetical protein
MKAIDMTRIESIKRAVVPTDRMETKKISNQPTILTIRLDYQKKEATFQPLQKA